MLITSFIRFSLQWPPLFCFVNSVSILWKFLSKKIPFFSSSFCNSPMANSPRAKRIRKDSSSSSSEPPKNPLANLPEDVLENVFTFLPIKDAVEMGTLSTRFKKTWRFNQKFLFGRDFSLRFACEELVEVIDHVFHSHEGKEIQSFHLNIDPNGIEPMINNWLRICIVKRIEDLELYFLQPGYTLRVGFINLLKKLRTLKLVNCQIQLPHMNALLRGMRFLNTLALWKLEFTEQKLETLVANCKFLKHLELYQCNLIRKINVVARNHKYLKTVKIALCPDVEQVNVNVPILGSFFYTGYITGFRFGESVALNDAFFNFSPTTLASTQQVEELEFLITNCLQGVKVLSTSALFPEGLAARMRNGVYQEAQFCLPNLKELQLFMEGAMLCNPYDILMFVKNCPSLESLFIDLNDYNFECGPFWELHHKPMFENFKYNFNELRIVKLKGFKFQKVEVELVKILLKKARKLEFLIFISPKNGRTQLRQPDAPKYSQLFQLCKASPLVKINLYDHVNDKAFHPSHPKFWY